MNDDLTVAVGSVQIDRLLSAEFESDLFTAADAFRITASNVRGYYSDVVKVEDIVIASVGGERIFYGRVDEIKSTSDGGGSKIEIAGRDLGRFLVDCSAKITSLANKSMIQIARELCLPSWQIVWTEGHSAPAQRERKMKVQPGESVLDVLTRLAETRKVLVWIDSQGRGVIGKPNYAQRATHSLYRFCDERAQKSNIVGGGVQMSSRELHSEITLLASVPAAPSGGGLLGGGGGSGLGGLGGAKTEAAKMRGKVFSTAIRDRPYIGSCQAANTAQVRALAEELMERRWFDAWQAEYTAADWRNDDALWAIDSMCSVVDQSCSISGERLYVAKRTLRLDESGRSTVVSLRKPGVYLP